MSAKTPFKIFLPKPLTNAFRFAIIVRQQGRLAQLGEHLPYKQRVIGSSPILSTKKEIGSFVSNIEGWLEGEAVQSELPMDVRDRGRPSAQFARDRALYFPPRDLFPHRNGLVAQLVRALACHARGRGFEPHPSRHSDMPL